MKQISKMIAVFALVAGTVQAGDNELRATIGTMFGKGYKIEMKVNGMAIPAFEKVTEGSSVAVQLFHRDYPMEDPLPAEYKYMLCLNRGTNTLEIAYKQLSTNKAPDDLDIYVQAIGYEKKLLEGQVKRDQKEGKLVGTFELYLKQPKTFETSKMKEPPQPTSSGDVTKRDAPKK
jgi:hypothetical protein